MNPRRARLARVSVCLAALPLGLVLAEGLARCTDLGPRPRPAIRGAVLRPSADPALGQENLENGVLVVEFLDRRGRLERVVEHRINRFGLRGPEVSPARSEGRFRIACVGDSQTAGLGVAEEETWPRRLEEQLAGRAEVLNFGVFGYRAAEKARLIETRVQDWAPDLIVLQLFVYESHPAQRRVARLAVRNPVTRLLRPDHPGWMAEVRSRSRFADYVADCFFRRAWVDNWTRASRGVYAAGNPQWGEMRTHLLRARDAAADGGSRFVVVFFPMLYENDGRMIGADLAALLGELCRDRGIPFLDLTPAYLGRDLERLRVHSRDYHYSAPGHALAAEHVAAFLRRERQLQP